MSAPARRLQAPLVLGVLAIVLLLAMLAGVMLGTVNIPLWHILGILANAVGLPVPVDWPGWQETVILRVRLPRVIVGVFVGGGLAICGATMQALFRNPLAGPDIIGVSAGASLGAVTALYLGLAAKSIWMLPLFAIVMAGMTLFAVFAISTRHGYTPMGTLLLAGVAVGSLHGALTSFIISLALGNFDIGRQMIYWLLGGLDGRTWEHVLLVAPATLLGAAVVFALARDLDALVVGEVHAAAVGIDVARVRTVLLITVSLLTGAAVAVSGAIGFVGLIVPHVVRLLVGPGHRRLLPGSLLLGAAFIAVADLVARTLIAPEEIRLGVITAVVGAPFFLSLLVRRRGEIPQ